MFEQTRPMTITGIAKFAWKGFFHCTHWFDLGVVYTLSGSSAFDFPFCYRGDFGFSVGAGKFGLS